MTTRTMDIYRLILLLPLITALWVPQGLAANTEAVLIQALLTNYDVSARPATNVSTPVVVTMGLVLQQIINLDERQQQLQIKVWLRYFWTDDSLRWNASDYGNITSIHILPHRIWKPDITLYDNMDYDPNDNNAKLFPSTVYHDGRVQWFVPKILISNCNVNVKYYPWDEQKCTLKFGSWTYDGTQLDLVNRSSSGDLTYYTTSSEWSILDFEARRNIITYNCCPEPYPDVTFTIHIRRKVMYYVINMILPSIFITFMAMLVFYLPPESGEKVSLTVTVLLALTVFLLIVAESVPKTETVPLIGQYFEAIILLMALSSALTVVTLNIHHRGVFGNKVPDWIRKVVLNWMARALCMKGMVDTNISPLKSTQICPDTQARVASVINLQVPNENQIPVMNGKNETAQAIKDILPDVMARFQNGHHNEDHEEACRTDWMLVAAVVDRFLLILFIIFTAITTLVILVNRPHSPEEPIA